MEASIDLSYTVLKEIQVSTKIRALFPLELCPKLRA